MIPVRVNLKVDQSQTVYPLTVNSNNLSMSVSIATPIQMIDGEKYRGSYEVVPSSERQTLSTALLTMTDDVIIHPIPSNYGLITWDGSILMVS